jgi:ABC-type uncharacterized transport system involved in gliding motility auxiliary subunit
MNYDQRQRLGRITLTLLALAFIAAVMASNTLLRGLRLDLTENQLYTLSPGTLSLLSTIEEPINLYYFFSDQGSADIQFLRGYATRVREMLEEFAANSDGMLILNVIDPLPFSEEEDRAARFGLQPVSLGGANDTIYFGLAATNSVGDEDTIDFFQPSKENFLEYDIARLVYNLANPDKVTVGLYSGVPLNGGFNPQTQQPTQPWIVAQQAQQLFDVRALPATLDKVEEDIDVLWIVHPTEVDEMSLYAIDQFILRGGRALIFVDPLAEVAAAAPNPMGLSPGSSSTLGKLFEAWGVDFDPTLAVVDNVNALSVGGGGFGQRSIRHIGLIGLDAAGMDQEDVVTSGLESVNLAVAGHIALSEGSTLTMTPLLQSSTDSATMMVDRFQFLPNPDDLLDDYVPTQDTYVLGARLQGTLQTAFPDGPPGEFEPTEDFVQSHVESTDSANMILIADVDILSDRLWAQRQSFLGQELLTAFASNGDLLVNALDNLSGSAELIGLRSRASYSRPFDTVDQLRRRADAQFRVTEQRLQAELAETERRLGELQSARDDSGSLLMSPEQQQELQRFLDEQARIRQELRAVRRELDRSIDRLGATLKLANIIIAPIAFALIALIVVPRVSGRRRSSS